MQPCGLSRKFLELLHPLQARSLYLFRAEQRAVRGLLSEVLIKRLERKYLQIMKRCISHVA